MPDTFTLTSEKNKKFTFIEGLNVLIGCNGWGKTTRLSELKHTVEHDYKVVSFDNLHQGGSNLVESMMFHDDMDGVMCALSSSEGQNIILGIGRIAAKIGKAIREAASDDTIFVLLDAIDSGLSIDNIEDLSDFIHETLIPDAQAKGVHVIIVAAANDYCLVKCADSRIDARSGKACPPFADYEAYCKFVRNCRKKLDKN